MSTADTEASHGTPPLAERALAAAHRVLHELKQVPILGIVLVVWAVARVRGDVSDALQCRTFGHNPDRRGRCIRCGEWDV